MAEAAADRGPRAGLRHRLEAGLLRFGYRLMGLLPVDAASAFAGWLGRNFGPWLPVSARARRNLRLAFPEMPQAEIEVTLRGMWDNLARCAAEYPHLGRICDPAGGRVELSQAGSGPALRSLRGPVILAAGHQANWEILQPLARRHGLEFAQVVRAPNNPLVAAEIERHRNVAGGRRLFKGAAMPAMRGHLEAGGQLGIYFDQRLGEGITARFFGHAAETVASPARLALRYRCPLHPVRIERLGGARFRFTLLPALPLPDSGDEEADTVLLTQQLNDLLETWIRARPEQWLWLHRRWPRTHY